MYGVKRLQKDLEDMNYSVEVLTGSDTQLYVIIRDYEIELGRFTGQVIDLGIMAMTNYPQGVPSAVHVLANPQLIEITENIPNVRNIQASPLGSEWRYWSKNFNWDGERSTRRLISQINTIFKDA